MKTAIHLPGPRGCQLLPRLRSMARPELGVAVVALLIALLSATALAAAPAGAVPPAHAAPPAAPPQVPAPPEGPGPNAFPDEDMSGMQPDAPPPPPPESPPAPPPQTPTAPAEPGTPPGETPPAVPSTPRKPAEGPILLNFQDASLRAVLEYLSGAAGLVIVQEATVEGRVTVMSRQPVTVEEAVSLLNTILKEKGYAAVRNGRTLRIVTLDLAKKAALPVRTGIDPAEIEATDQLVTYVIPIQSGDAAQLKRDLAPLIPSYADLSANASTNTLILTDTQMNVRRFVEIIRALDSRMATVSEVKVFQLKYANAANAARLINDLFRTDQTTQGGQGGGGGRRFMFPGMPPGGPQQGDSGQSSTNRLQKVTASSDDRTNTLVVSGPPDLLKVIEGVVKELDANPTEEQAVFLYSVKNAKAINLEAVLNNLFGWSGSTSGRTTTSPQGSTMSSRSGAGTSGRGMGGSGGFRSGGVGSSSGFGSSRGSSGGFGSTGAFGSGGGTAQTRGTTRLSSSSAAAASDLAGQAFVVADEDTNSLLVTAATKNFERIKAILVDLDRPVPQVLIKVLIAEVRPSDTLDVGAEFSILNLRASGNGQTGGTDFSVAAQTTGLSIQILETDVTAAIHALATVGKLDVLSRPYILTSDNQEAAIMVGEEVPFITRSQLTDNGQTINTVEYDNIGIILTVTPHINPDGLVIMDVYPEISARTGDSIPISDTVDAPVFARRAAQSRVAIRDGQTIVIGGLMQDIITNTVSKVPILGDIPLLGALFQRVEREKTKTELFIFITPHVARVPDDLKSMSKDEEAGGKAIHEAVEPGAFQEHMKGMQRGAAAPSPEKENEKETEPLTREYPPAAPESKTPPAGARDAPQP